MRLIYADALNVAIEEWFDGVCVKCGRVHEP